MLSFKRVIHIVVHGTAQQGEVRAALEDDYHHFRVKLQYRNDRICDASAEAIRIPYTLCGNSITQIAQLNNAPLQTVAHHINQYTDARLQCTHQLDLAGIAIATVAKSLKSRQYRIDVPRHEEGFTQPSLWRDDKKVLQWDVRDNVITGPAPFVNIALGKGMANWALETLDNDTAEAALILRRCTSISLGRLRNLDLEKHAKDWGRCYTQQPERAHQATRVIGSTQDFTDREQDLCQDDQTWLHTTTSK